MPRSARKQSDWGMYHAMLRGINRQRIFEDDEDRRLFLNILADTKEKTGFRLFAWCLMPNHVHLLLQEGKEPIGQIFRLIGTKYVYWYNRRHGRTGHLFQDRFRSETVEDDAGFVTVIRYIHMNPVKAGLSDTPEEYPWCSYRDYFDPNGLTDPSMILGMMDRDTFYRFHAENAPDRCMDMDEKDRTRLPDEKVLEILRDEFGCSDGAELALLPEAKRAAALGRLLKDGGSIRQVSRLTGASVGIVRKYTQHREPSPVFENEAEE